MPIETLKRRSTARSPTTLLTTLVLCAAGLVHAQSPGEVTINGSRTYRITADTEFSLDGVAISAAAAGQLGPGYSVLVTAGNVAAGAQQGDAQQVDFDNLVRGPITSADPLAVLNQPVVTSAETVLIGIPGDDLTALQPGQLLEVSGYLDADAGVIVASRVGLIESPDRDWKLVGEVSMAATDAFRIGAQQIDSSGVIATQCPQGVIDGVFVELEALPNPDYGPTAVLGQLISLHCEDPAFGIPPPGTTVASLEGIVTALPDPLPTPPRFDMLGVTVLTDAQTSYRAGGIDDLAVGARVEVDGAFDPALRTLLAREVRFTQAQARFIAPLTATDLIAGERVTIMGNSVLFNAQTRDEDGLAAGGIAVPVQVEVRALIDADGTLVSSRIRDRGNPDLTDTRLQGPLAAIAEPVLEVLGNSIDTSTAQFRDSDGTVLSAVEFYSVIHLGTVISAEDALYDPDTGSLLPARVEIEDDLPPPPPILRGIIGAQGLTRGTVTGLGAADVVFSSGFE